MKVQKGQIVVSIVTICVMVLFDQITKKAVEIAIPLHQSIEVIYKFIYLTYTQNTGAGFSIMEGANISVFAGITIFTLVLLVYFFMTSDGRYQVCLTFIIAGTLGNFIDRLRFGYVRDFFLVYIFGKPFPVFNVADICITMGFLVLIALVLYDDHKEKKQWRIKHSK